MAKKQPIDMSVFWNGLISELKAKELDFLFGIDHFLNIPVYSKIPSEAVRKALEVLQDTKAMPDSDFYDKLAVKLDESGNAKFLQNIANVMEQKMCMQPSQLFYGIWLHCAMRTGGARKAEMFFEHLRTRDLAGELVFAKMADAFLDAGNVAEAGEMVMEIDMRYPEPSYPETFAVLARFGLARKNWSKVLNILEHNGNPLVNRSLMKDLLQSGNSSDGLLLPIENFVPSTPIDRALMLRFLAKFKAHKLDMKSLASQLNTEICNAVLSILVDKDLTGPLKDRIANEFLAEHPPAKQYAKDDPSSLAFLIQPTLMQNFVSIVRMMEQKWQQAPMNIQTLELIYRRYITTANWTSICQVYEWHQELLYESLHPAYNLIDHQCTQHHNAYLTGLLKSGRLGEAINLCKKLAVGEENGFVLAPRNISILEENGLLVQELTKPKIV